MTYRMLVSTIPISVSADSILLAASILGIVSDAFCNSLRQLIRHISFKIDHTLKRNACVILHCILRHCSLTSDGY